MRLNYKSLTVFYSNGDKDEIPLNDREQAIDEFETLTWRLENDIE